MSCLYEAYIKACMIVGGAAPGSPTGAIIGTILSENEVTEEASPPDAKPPTPRGFA